MGKIETHAFECISMVFFRKKKNTKKRIARFYVNRFSFLVNASLTILLFQHYLDP